MKLSSKNKELLINILLLFVLPLIIYGITLRNNAVTREYLGSLELTEEGKKEIEFQLNNLGEFEILNNVD